MKGKRKLVGRKKRLEDDLTWERRTQWKIGRALQRERGGKLELDIERHGLMGSYEYGMRRVKV